MEGPSLVILNEELLPFLGKKVLKVSGNTKQPKESLKGFVLEAIDTWGKVLLLTFSDPFRRQESIVVKTHFLLFGSYRINEPKENNKPRLQINFSTGKVFFYSCSIQFNPEEYINKFDAKVDIMSPEWSEEHVLKLMDKKRDTYLCDLLLDQSLFAGSGNIVKNEVLFIIRRHPLTRLKKINQNDWPLLIYAIRDYCFSFYE